MESTDNLDAVVSMIMVNLPFPPMPIMACKGSDNEDSSCSSHDLLSQAISCSIIECWNEMDTNLKTTEKQQGKIDVLLNLNRANASLHENRVQVIDEGPSLTDNIQSLYELYANYFRQYMSFYPGDPDIRILPMDSVDVKSTVHNQTLQHLRAKRYNVNDKSPVSQTTPYRQLIELYSKDLYSEHAD